MLSVDGGFYFFQAILFVSFYYLSCQPTHYLFSGASVCSYVYCGGEDRELNEIKLNGVKECFLESEKFNLILIEMKLSDKMKRYDVR
jgi:hypothetical protein